MLGFVPQGGAGCHWQAPSARVTSPSAFVILEVRASVLWYQSFWSSDRAVRPGPCPLITAANVRSARRRQRLSSPQATGFWSAANAACRLRDWRGLTKLPPTVSPQAYRRGLGILREGMSKFRVRICSLPNSSASAGVPFAWKTGRHRRQGRPG